VQEDVVVASPSPPSGPVFGGGVVEPFELLQAAAMAARARSGAATTAKRLDMAARG
jgi:hypothetical protein